ncbi:YnfU family zinc-binding protein [Limnobaculum sp. M2-1]|uniref:YnfU family zinc-binding protein n=1 Tax=Limnobaculum TaxID=2172100 RepID=UPI003899687A|nr:YnfU family zinc-binding protein [Limnobaculum sp. M2-1]
MSYLNEIIQKVRERTSTVECPVCKESSKQLTLKISQELVLCCPHCRALFVIHR